MIQKYKIPPFESMFQPTTTVFEDNITYVEFLTGILCRLNEVIDLVNKHEEFINNYAGKIEEIEAEVRRLYEDFDVFKNEINASITAQFNAINTQLDAKIASATAYMRAYTDNKYTILDNKIDTVALGQINVYDPTTGTLMPLQTVINNLYDAGRDEAITATEYDTLELSATEYDALEITAYNFDQYGKTILTSD